MRTALIRELSELFSSAADPAEMSCLLEGLLTPSEVEEIAFRWRLMRRLLRGDTQREISHDLGLSLGKIARGSRLLKYGPPRFRQKMEQLARKFPDTTV